MTFPSQAVLADRLKHIEGSPTLALAAKAKALAKAGKPVLDFTAGEPDVPTPEPIKQAGIRAIQANHTIEFTECLPNRGVAANVITRSKNVRGVEADTQSIGFTHAADNVCQMLEFVPQA